MLVNELFRALTQRFRQIIFLDEARVFVRAVIHTGLCGNCRRRGFRFPFEVVASHGFLSLLTQIQEP